MKPWPLWRKILFIVSAATVSAAVWCLLFNFFEFLGGVG